MRQLANVLRAEAAGADLQDGPNGIHVYAMRQDWSRYELGSVSHDAAAQEPEQARRAIERIKFAHRDAKGVRR